MAELLRGAPVAASIQDGLAPRVRALRDSGVVPALAIVRVGARSDDLSYERAAEKRCDAVGVEVRKHVLPEGCTQEDLEGVLAGVSRDPRVHGCLLFRPLPSGLDEGAASVALDSVKDVDAITEGSLLSTLAGRPGSFAPCTAEAVVALLDHYGVELDGSEVCVVGRSLVIGRPVAALLLSRNATVTVCHTHTRDLSACCRRADVIVAAAGHAGTIDASSVSEGQVVVDVGINWDEREGRLVGDVDFDAVEPIARAITPVPGGVGSVTTSILARHVVEAAERTLA